MTRATAGGAGVARRVHLREVALVVAAWLAYFGIRAVTEGRPGVAVAHARDVVALERRLGIAWEGALQDVVLGHRAIVDAANWVYTWGHWPVIVIVGLWLHARHRADYLLLRNAILLSGGVGILIFLAYPLAPPRLAELGLTDTVTRWSDAYRALQPPALTNQYAAMPSLHVGWDLLVGLAIVRAARPRPARVLGALLPVAMALAVVGTANHFVLDVVAGVALALAGHVAARVLAERRARRLGAMATVTDDGA